MVDKALLAFFIILFIILILVLLMNGVLNRLVDGVLEKKIENFISPLTGLETRDDEKINREIPLKVHTERGYQQNNFQVPNDIPLSQTSYAYYINKYFMNPKINKSVDEELEIVGNANLQKPDFLYDGVWKRDVKSMGDYQRASWSPAHPINEKRGMLSMDGMLKVARNQPMPNEVEGNECFTKTMPFWEYDKICEPSVNQKCDVEYKSEDIKCFQIYLDPLAK